MNQRQRIDSQNQTIQGRVRTTRPAFVYERPHAQVQPKPRTFNSVDGFHAPRPVRLSHATNTATPHLKAPVRQSHDYHLPSLPDISDLAHQIQSNIQQQALNTFTPNSHSSKKYRKPLMPSIISVMAVLLFSVGAFTAIQGYRANRVVKAQVQGLTTANEDGIGEGLPSEDDAPSDTSNYQVAPDLPRFFTIEKLNVHARVRRLGVNVHNVMKSPANIFDVGWYDGSAKPGENGTVVMNGHVSGPTKRGVFNSIHTLEEGDKVQVERGDGKVITYSVTGKKVYDNDKVDMAKVMTSSVPGKPGMNFITCSGRFNVRTSQYEQRVVIFTVQD